MLLPHKNIFLLCFLFLTACGFQPLYSGRGSADVMSGKQLTQHLRSIFIDEIANREGQILRQSLANNLTPFGEPDNPRYRLSVRLSAASIAQQGVQKDNLATRYVMGFTAYYTLYSYPDNKKLLSDRTIAQSSYDVQLSPYATDVAERFAKERIMKILGDDIALRLAAFFKSYSVTEPVDDKAAQ